MKIDINSIGLKLVRAKKFGYFVIVLSFLVLVPLQFIIKKQINAQYIDVINAIEKKYSVDIVYHNKFKSFLSYISIANIKVVSTNEEKPFSLTISHFGVSLNIFNLLFLKSNDAKIVSSIKIDRPVLTIEKPKKKQKTEDDLEALKKGDTSTPKELLSSTLNRSQSIARGYFDKMFKILEKDKEAFLPHIDLDIRHFSLHYEHPFAKVSLQNGMIYINPAKNAMALDFKVDLATQIYGLKEIKVPIQIGGSMDYTLNSADLLFKIKAFKSPYISMVDQGLILKWGKGYLNLNKSLDAVPLDFELALDSFKKQIKLNFEADDFTLGDENTLGIAYIDAKSSLLYYADKDILIYDLASLLKYNSSKSMHNLTINLAGNESSTTIKELSLVNPFLNVNYKGKVDLKTLLPYDGSFGVSTSFKNKPFIFNSTFQKTPKGMVANSNNFSIDGVSLGSIVSTVNSSNGQYSFKTSYKNHTGNIDFMGLYNINSSDLHVDSSAKDFGFKVFSDLKLIPKALAKFKLNHSISVDYSKETLFSVNGDFLNIEKDDAHGLKTAFMLNNSELSIYNMGLEWGDRAFKANLYSKLSKNPSFNGVFSNKALSYPYTGSYSDSILNLAYEFGQLRLDTLSSVLHLNIKDMPLALSSDSQKVNLDANYNYANKPIFTLNKLSIANSVSQLEMSRGFFEADKGRLELIAYKDQLSSLRGSGDYLQKGDSYNAIFRVVGEGGEFYSLKAFYGTDFKGQINIENFPLERLGVPDLDGKANISLDINSIKNPNGSAKFNITGFQDREKLVLNGEANIDSENFIINNAFLQKGSWGLSGILLIAKLKENSISFSTQAGKMNGTIETGMAMVVKSASANKDLSFTEFLKNDLKILLQIDPFNNKGRNMLSSTRLVLFKRSDSIDIRGLNNIDLNANYGFATKLLKIDLRDKDGISVKVDGNLNTEDLSVNVSSLRFPLPLFNPYLIYKDKKRIIGIEKGYLIGDATIGKGLDIDANVEFKDTVITSPFVPNTKLKLNHKLKMVDNVLTLGDDFNFKLRDGINRGSFKLQGRLIAFPVLTYDAAIVIEGAGAPIMFDANGVRFKGRVVGYATYRGDKRSGQLRGRITANNMEGSLGSWSGIATKPYKKVETHRGKSNPGYHLIISPNHDLNQSYFDGNSNQFISANRDQSKDTSELFTIVAGKNVTFYVPNKNIPTLVVTASEGSEANLMVDLVKRQSVSAFVETDMSIARGEINYFSNNFVIRNGGKLRMNKDIGFNAQIEFDADMKPDPLKNDIITMHFKNRVMDTYKPTFTSEPAMTEMEIMTRLGATFVPNVSLPGDDQNSAGLVNNEDHSSSGFETVVKATGDYAGQYLSRSVENVLRKLKFIDTVSVKTDIVSNMILENFGQGDVGSTKDNGARNMAQYLEGSSIHFGSFVDNKFFINANISAVEQDNTLVSSANVSNIVPSVGLGVQFTTNLIDIDWSVATDVDSVNKINPSGVNNFAFTPEVKLTLSKSYLFKEWHDIGKTKKQLQKEKEKEQKKLKEEAAKKALDEQKKQAEASSKTPASLEEKVD